MKNRPAVAIEYIKILNGKDVANNIQGQAVEIPHDIPPNDLLAIFPFIFENCSEAVLRSEGNRLFLLFSHHEQEFIRPEKIDMSVFEEIERLSENIKFAQSSAMPIFELDIDLEENRNSKNFLQNVSEKLKPALNLVFSGKVSILEILAFLCLVRPSAHNIFYKNADGSKVAIFSKKI